MSSDKILLAAAGKVDHWKFLAEFAREEGRGGGPAPHLALSVAMAQEDGAGYWERAWRGFCYASCYVVSTAAVVWREWSWERVRSRPQGIESWLRKNWKGIAIRNERKSVRSPEKLTRFFLSAREWLLGKESELGMRSGWIGDGSLPTADCYEVAWEDVQRVYTVGRYIATRILEYGRRSLQWRTEMPDIRPVGGDTPRQCMVLLYPRHKDLLLGSDSSRAIGRINRLAEEARLRLLEDYGLPLDYYLFQTCLCEYKQSYLGGKQFPGRSHDSEMKHERNTASYWGTDGEFYRVRQRIFPHLLLGELGGWDGVRKELGECLPRHGYTWTDFRYDYMKSRTDLSRPVRRSSP